ncbi:MAG: hydroxyacid dehydrogenase [Myxococcaceae bacterium]|nr:hydroxyacid dehydrogenase [Myxococcaceae bacterium]
MKLVVADRFSREALERLSAAGLEVHEHSVPAGADPAAAEEALAARLEGARALVVRSQTQVTASLLEKAPSLWLVGRAGVGYENIDISACERLGVAVMNTPGASAITTAERTLALLLSMLHQIPQADRSMRAGKWDRRSFLANEAFDKRVGVLGFGNVGRVVADRARALQMRVLVHDPYVPPEMAFNLGHRPVGFDELFRESDIVTCHVSASPALKGLVGQRELGLMRKGSWLVNTSRGWVVEQAALVEALRSGHLAGAALDVFEEEPLPAESPLRGLDRLILSPHLGASTVEAERRVSLSLADQMIEFLKEGRGRNLIGAPKELRHPGARPRG